MELSFSNLDESQISERQELFVDCFPETSNTTASSVEHFRWKFHASKNSWNFIGVNERGLVGGYSAIRFDYLLRNKNITVGMVCDVMTSSQARGKGVFTKLGSYATSELLKECDVLTGYPIRPEVIPGHLKVGWEIAAELPLYIKPLRLDNWLMLKGVPSVLASPLNVFYRKLIAVTISNKNAYGFSEFKDWNNFYSKHGQAYDIFTQNTNQWSNFRLVRSAEFMKWRLSAPDRTYKIVVIHDSKFARIEEIVILREIERDGLSCLCVLDASSSVSGNSRIPATLDLLGKSSENDIVLMMCDKNSFKKLGFTRKLWFNSGKSFKWILKSKTNDIIRQLVESKPSLFWLDSDDL